MDIILNNDSITLEFIDKHFFIYRYLITTNDMFVVNFMNKDINKMYELLKDNKDYCIKINANMVEIEYNKPIVLNFKLLKCGNVGDNSNLINENNELKEKIKNLEDINLQNEAKITEITCENEKLNDEINQLVISAKNTGNDIQKEKYIISDNVVHDSECVKILEINNDYMHSLKCHNVLSTCNFEMIYSKKMWKTILHMDKYDCQIDEKYKIIKTLLSKNIILISSNLKTISFLLEREKLNNIRYVIIKITDCEMNIIKLTDTLNKLFAKIHIKKIFIHQDTHRKTSLKIDVKELTNPANKKIFIHTTDDVYERIVSDNINIIANNKYLIDHDKKFNIYTSNNFDRDLLHNFMINDVINDVLN